MAPEKRKSSDQKGKLNKTNKCSSTVVNDKNNAKVSRKGSAEQISSDAKPKSKLLSTVNFNGNINLEDNVSANALAAKELEATRKRLLEIELDCRNEINAKSRQAEYEEEKLASQMREKILNDLETQIKLVEQSFAAQISQVSENLIKKQEETLLKLRNKANSSGYDNEKIKTVCTSEQLSQIKSHFKAEIAAQKAKAQEDIEEYRRLKEQLLEEQIKVLRVAMIRDLEHFSSKRNESLTFIIDKINELIQAEIKFENIEAQLNVSISLDVVRDKLLNVQSNDVALLNEKMAKSLTETRLKYENDLVQMLRKRKESYDYHLDKIRNQAEEKYKEERCNLTLQLQTLQETVDNQFDLKKEEVERRKRTKEELLKMLAMTDTHKIADEELVTTRFGYFIERGKDIVISNSSVIYAARSKTQQSLLVKTTPFTKWSVRHRMDFHKHSTRLMRYLTANRDKAPYFVKICDVMATDSKLYVFMEPLSCSNTLASYLFSQVKVLSKKTNKTLTNLKKTEMVNVLTQVVNAIEFLSNLFIAYVTLIPENITLIIDSDKKTLSNCQIVLTGFTRPLVYFNVECDEKFSIKGFDIETEIDNMDHLPPECYDATFIPERLDAYSIGVLIYLMIRGRSPYYDTGSMPIKVLTEKKLGCVKLILNSEESEEHGKSELSQIVAHLTQPMFTRRMSSQIILKQPYFAKKQQSN